MSALAWREDEKGLCSHRSCGSAGCPGVPGEVWAGEDSACPLLHCNVFWSPGPAAWRFWEIAFPEDKTGALCLFFSLCLFLSCFSSQLHITESLEIQL